mgnify:CR=1
YSYLLASDDGEKYSLPFSVTNESGEIVEENFLVRRKSNQHFLMKPTYYKNFLKYKVQNALIQSYFEPVDEQESLYKKYNNPYFEISP